MRFIRLLLVFLAVALALSALVVGVALIPGVQTFLLEQALMGRPGLKASVKSLSAGLSQTRVAEVRVEYEGAILKLPVLDAALPLKAALWDRKLLVGNLVAKGWTLDLTQWNPPERIDTPAPSKGATSSGRPTAEAAAAVVGGFLSSLKLPYDLALDGVNLDGDVLLALTPGQGPTKVRLTLKGGGLAPGHPGEFTVDALVIGPNPRLPRNTVVVRGKLAVALASPRTVQQLEFNGGLSAEAGELPVDLGLVAKVATEKETGAETYIVELNRGARHLVALSGRRLKDKPAIAGTWSLDVQDADLAPIYPDRRLPAGTATGEGRFETDLDFEQVRTSGRIKTVAGSWGGLAPALGRSGTVTIETEFAATHREHTLTVEQIALALAGERPVGTVRAVQAFAVNEVTGLVKAVDPAAEWLRGTFQGLPLGWLGTMPDGWTLTGSDLTGDFAVMATEGDFTLRATSPLVAKGVIVQPAGAATGPKLDVALSLIAGYTRADGWRFQGAPLTLASGGRPLASLTVKAAPLEERGRWLALDGTWSADLEALAAQPLPGAGLIRGRTGSGNFAIKVGTVNEVKVKLNVIGHDPTHTLTANASGLVDARGGVSFHVPVTVSFGTEVSQLSGDGTWTKEKAARRLELELSAVDTSLDHLALFAPFLPLADGASLAKVFTAGAGGPPPSTTAVVRDARPFWGDLVGHVKFNLYNLRRSGEELHDVAGNLTIAPDSLRLEGGRGVIAPPPAAKTTGPRDFTKPEPLPNKWTAEGTVTFAAVGDGPYQLKGTATAEVIDGAAWFATSAPVVEGRWSVAGTLTGSGATVEHLIAHRREELHLTSNGGVLRLLKSGVAEAMPAADTPVSDTLGTVGAAVGSLFGFKGKSLTSGVSSLSKPAEAILDVSYQLIEFRYDLITLTASRSPDGALLLKDIAITAANEHLTGTGEIAEARGRPLRARPLRLELMLGAKGAVADRFGKAGLLTGEKDAAGYSLLRPPIHFGGTLEQVDPTAWRDLLIKTATQPTGKDKKGS